MEFGPQYTTALIRWSHIFLGIMWIGFFYFMHLIVRPYLASLDGDAKSKAYRALLARGLRWVRGTSMATLLLGLGVLGHLWSQGVYAIEGQGLVGRGKYIMWGMTFAVAMWANVWFFISPLQKRIVAAFEADIGPSEADLAKAGKLGNINLYLSAPMLMLMVFAQNFPAFHYGHMGLAIVVGMIVAHILVVIARNGNN
ncbi:MAG: putative membrane protein [Planctomycetota bacterium]|jgi:uncharacterized membrane protein